MNTVGIALGTNLGNRLLNLLAARTHILQLLAPESKILSAPIFQTPPIDCPEESADFYNTVLEFSYQGTPEQLLQSTQKIEITMGRQSKGAEHLPRIIDLDLLYFGDNVIQTPELEIPHPRISSRRFVLEPLYHLRPELILPNQSESIQDLLHKSPEAALEIITHHW